MGVLDVINRRTPQGDVMEKPKIRQSLTATVVIFIALLVVVFGFIYAPILIYNSRIYKLMEVKEKPDTN